MRTDVACLAVTVLLASTGAGCATKKCMERYTTMAGNEAIRRDGEILTRLVAHRTEAARLAQAAGGQSSEGEDLVRSVQAWEMGIRLIVQIQNLSREPENAGRLAEQRDLLSRIRCLATRWSEREGHVIGTSEGLRMLDYQRQLERAFGERGRPTDSQLTAICEGGEIYMGPIEEEVDVPEVEGGTGPGTRPAGAQGEQGAPGTTAPQEGSEGGTTGGQPTGTQTGQPATTPPATEGSSAEEESDVSQTLDDILD